MLTRRMLLERLLGIDNIDDFIKTGGCKVCAYKDDLSKCFAKSFPCREGIKKWLDSEVENEQA